MIAYCLHFGSHVIMIGDGFLSLALDSVCLATGINHSGNSALDLRDMLAYRFYRREILRGNAVWFVTLEEFLYFIHIVEQQRLITYRSRDDVVYGKIPEHTTFNLDFLRIHLPLHLVACLDLLFGEHAGFVEHLDARREHIGVIHQRRRSLGVESAARRLLFPLLAISVAVEMNSLRCFH